MSADPCVIASNGTTCQLRIIRKITKDETDHIARFARLMSSDRLVEALAFPFISQPNVDIIEGVLLERLAALEQREGVLLDGN